MKHTVTVDAIRAAADRIAPWIHRTPVLTNHTLDEQTGCRLFFKCENLQKAGAFKSRGACNVVFGLEEESARQGVVTHSSGNHAAALARAAAMRSIPAHIVMPRNAPRVKVDAVREYGGTIHFCEPTLAARESTADSVQKETGAHFVHPYDDVRIITGQATAALELCEACPELDVVIAPVGGGGLLAGTVLSVQALRPGCRIIGAEPEAVNDAWLSLQSGTIQPATGQPSLGDGLLTSLGLITFPIIQAGVERIILASEQTIRRATNLFHERMKQVVEPSGAVPLAAILDEPGCFAGLKVGVLISGGNVDLADFYRSEAQ